MFVCLCSFKDKLSRIFRILEPSSHRLGSMNTSEGIIFVISQVGFWDFSYKFCHSNFLWLCQLVPNGVTSLVSISALNVVFLKYKCFGVREVGHVSGHTTYEKKNWFYDITSPSLSSSNLRKTLLDIGVSAPPVTASMPKAKQTGWYNCILCPVSFGFCWCCCLWSLYNHSKTWLADSRGWSHLRISSLFADDAVLLSSSDDDLQLRLEQFTTQCGKSVD